MGRIGVLEKSGINVVVFSTPEIHILYSIFEESFDIFSVDYLSQEPVIEEFFSILILIREHIANDIIKHCSERILEHTKKRESFFGLWKAMTKSIILGNAIKTQKSLLSIINYKLQTKPMHIYNHIYQDIGVKSLIFIHLTSPYTVKYRLKRELY